MRRDDQRLTDTVEALDWIAKAILLLSHSVLVPITAPAPAPIPIP